ncbi:MAG: PfaD family polyunsaturated fatty acid/polyketide biosynthesis protein [Pseudomonadota bacterium]
MQENTSQWCGTTSVDEAIRTPDRPIALVFRENGEVTIAQERFSGANILPPVYPERMGSRTFKSAHSVRFAYVVGAMARGITTAEMVVAAQQAGFLAFFGAAGLELGAIEIAIDHIQSEVGPGAGGWGSNLIHAPQTPETERATVDLYLRKGVRRMSASAFMGLSPEIVRYAAKGMTLSGDSTIVRRNHVFAKVSHPHVATAFMSPAPADMARDLVAAGDLTEEEADCITRLPVACDITAEADSGGHTDNRPASVLLASLGDTRETVCRRHGLDPATIRIGLAGGIGTPSAVAGAYAMGADYVVTGSVNQPTVESGLSEAGREMLLHVAMDDVAMAPAADMFERGVKVQVLRRGTLFSARAERLFQLYRAHEALETLNHRDRDFVESCLGEPIDAAWEKTFDYLKTKRPKDAARVEASPKARMAFLFRRYLFQCAEWARNGDTAHGAEYQIWCGPALGAFNRWVAGSPLEPLESRTVRRVGYALLKGAAQVTRAQQLRSAGVYVPSSLFTPKPLDHDGRGLDAAA